MDKINEEQLMDFIKAHGIYSSPDSDSDEGHSQLDENYYRYQPSPIPFDQLMANSATSTTTNDNYEGECSKLISPKYNEAVKGTPSANSSKSPPKSPPKTYKIENEEQLKQLIQREVKAQIDKLKDEYELPPKVHLPDDSKEVKKQFTQDVLDGKCLVEIKTLRKISNYVQNASLCLNVLNRKSAEQQGRFDHIRTNLTNAEHLLSSILEN